MDWMIYPAVKTSIKICAALFGACSILVALSHMLVPILLHSTEQVAGYMIAGTWASLLVILSLSCIAIWGTRVLLAACGNQVTRVLSSLTLLPALYALLIPFSAQPVPFQYSEMERIWEIFLLLTSITSFFAFPYTRGYPAPARKLFLAWGILAVCNSLQSLLFFLFLLLRGKLSGLYPPLSTALSYAFPLLSCGLDVALAILSAILAWFLYRNVMGIASLPSPQNPEIPERGE